MEESPKKTVYSVAKEIISGMEYGISAPQGKAALAKLRHATGRDVGNVLAVVPFIFEKMPESFLGRTGTLTKEERAILATTELYAWHQQGKERSMNSEEKYKNIGKSLRRLRQGPEKEAMDRRFTTLITASDFDELTYYLRQMIRLLRAKTEETINYPQLANDLYGFLQGDREKWRISWARDYYSTKGDDSNEN